ncbi:protein PNS1-like [Iris pallida]|uniref:Choline transporter-like protein n=1 Tax=Iris pallida TaxID=29817 RepID=A0AAX6E7G9_IRIPA|nr:protein PNS1-like [Iris pallida]
MVRLEKKRDSVRIHIRALERSEDDNGRTANNPTPAPVDASSSSSGSNHINVPRTNQVAPTQVDEAAAAAEPPAAGATTFTSKLFKLLFFSHLLVLAILIAFLSIRGYFTKSPTFRLARYFTPLLSSVASAVVVSLLCLLWTLAAPAKSLKHSLWLSPLSTCSMGVLLLLHSTAAGLAFGAVALALAVAQSFYACWITARLPYAYRVLSLSVSNVGFSATVGARVVLALAASAVYSSFWALGVGSIAASADAGRLVPVYLLLLLLSLAWTMHVIRNVVHVAVSHIAHARLLRGADVSARDAFGRACGRAFGNVCVGSATASAVGLFRGTARTMGLLAGGTDEFMFSCTGCCQGVADRLVEHANEWGFVHVGAYGKGFVRASEDTWGMFRQRRMEGLIDQDLTGSFCFLSGTAVGATSALIGGSWMLVVDSARATGVTVYAFVVGYFIMRIAMAWPQACVSAYHVAYAEDPRSDSTIPQRLRELERSPH